MIRSTLKMTENQISHHYQRLYDFLMCPTRNFLDHSGGKSENRRVKIPCQSIIESPTHWKLTREGPLSGELNMERDRDALEAQRDVNAVPAVRLYHWTQPTVSYGRLQSRESAEVFALARGGKALVQRPTGGGMVFHDTDLSLSVAWRRDHPTLPSCIKMSIDSYMKRLPRRFVGKGWRLCCIRRMVLSENSPGRVPGIFAGRHSLGRSEIGGGGGAARDFVGEALSRQYQTAPFCSENRLRRHGDESL